MAIQDLTGVNKDLAELKRANQIVDEVFNEIKDELHDDLNKILVKLKTQIKVDLMDRLGSYKFENK
tara:strand:+ start:1405 stop:1602 length:198 start_codon:yes stop_codon:yes gene_type:complete